MKFNLKIEQAVWFLNAFWGESGVEAEKVCFIS